MNEILILGAIFLAVLIIAFGILSLAQSRRELAENLEGKGGISRLSNEQLDEALGSNNPRMHYYLSVAQNADENSIELRLIQAGFLSPSAVWWFMITRLFVTVTSLFLVQLLFSIFLPTVTTLVAILFSTLISGVSFILVSAALEARGRKRMREHKKLFPDLMDLLLVCVDAGLSINAAIDRVTREFLQTTPDFGVQLSIISLEVRAGLPLHEAVSNFSRRINLEEARILSVLFRQSEELGSSVANTLRSFSKEMRQLRIIRAEEKANSLPVKMLFPMALFIFPVNLIIVLVPILMIIMAMMSQLTPGQ